MNNTIWETTNLGIEKGSESEEYSYQLKDSSGTVGGRISFDEKTALPPVSNVAILARYKEERNGIRYFVMFIRPMISQDGYERLGIGMLDQECLKDTRMGSIF